MKYFIDFYLNIIVPISFPYQKSRTNNISVYQIPVRSKVFSVQSDQGQELFGLVFIVEKLQDLLSIQTN